MQWDMLLFIRKECVMVLLFWLYNDNAAARIEVFNVVYTLPILLVAQRSNLKEDSVPHHE